MDRFGEDAAQGFVDRITYGGAEILAWSYPSDKKAVSALLGLPAPLFLDALEYALDLLGRVPSGEWEVGGFVAVGIAHINRVFEKRGIHYRFNEDGKAEWHGDESTHREVIEPALAALEDTRLAGSKLEFDAAMTNLRRGTEQDRREAVTNAGRSVEILAAPNLATTHGRHGVGQPVDVPPGVPELAVQSAAAAISSLANLLP